MAYNMGGRRFRPVGSGKKRTAPQYGPVGTGCPFVEEAVRGCTGSRTRNISGA